MISDAHKATLLAATPMKTTRGMMRQILGARSKILAMMRAGLCTTPERLPNNLAWAVLTAKGLVERAKHLPSTGDSQ